MSTGGFSHKCGSAINSSRTVDADRYSKYRPLTAGEGRTWSSNGREGANALRNVTACGIQTPQRSEHLHQRNSTVGHSSFHSPITPTQAYQ